MPFATARPTRQPGKPFMSLRLLLVEDDRELRATLRAALSVEGYQVLTAASLAEAIAMYGQTQLEEAGAQAFDLILLDLGLPDGDGSDLLVKLRGRKSACWMKAPMIIWSNLLASASCWRVCAWHCAIAATRCARPSRFMSRAMCWLIWPTTGSAAMVM